MKTTCCYGCVRRNVPECYHNCPDYQKLQADFAAKKAYLSDAAIRQQNFAAAHVDLSKKRRKR